MEGSLLYSHALALVYSTLVTSFILDIGRGVGMLLHFPLAHGDVQQGYRALQQVCGCLREKVDGGLSLALA